MRTPAPVPRLSPLTTRRAWLRHAAALPLWASAGASSWAQPASAAAEEARAPALPALGSELKVPRLALLDGGVFDSVKAQGRPLLVYWWASTCPFCALQSPHMETFWRSQKDRGLVMLALSIDRTPEAASAYLRAKGYTFPSGWASPQWRQAFPKPRGLPITLLCGRDGKVLLAERGQMFPEDIQAMADLI